MLIASGTDHLFVVCQAGAESALKRELARERPGFRFGFSRPGFVTFRRPNDGVPVMPEIDIGAGVFARAFGACLGRAPGGPSLEGVARAILERARDLSAELGGRKLCFHVFERERFVPGEEPQDFRPGGWAAAMKAALAAAAAGGGEAMGAAASGAGASAGCAARDLPQNGDYVLDVIMVEECEAWLGIHRHSGEHSPYPGGNPGLALPEDAPSRAWLKIEEALRWPGVPVRAGDTVIELGAAPGGAAHALLARGLRVYGIDSGEIAANVRANPQFTWIRGTAQDALAGERLPKSAEWLLLDIHARGEIALRELEAYVRRYYRPTLRGMVLTLKLGNWGMADLAPRWLEKVRAMGMGRVRGVQLPSNKQEFCVVALKLAD